MNPLDHFRAELRRHGLNYCGPIVANGRLYRFKAEGDHDRNSWFVLFPGPPLASGFGCWRRGIKESWCEKQPRQMSQREWDDVRRRWQEADRERHQAEVDRQAKARKLARWIIERAQPATSEHPYLRRKGVTPTDGLFVRGDELVIPLVDASGDLQSLQLIAPIGEKRFLPGGRVTGCMAIIGNGNTEGALIICEGCATGLSLHEATGIDCVCSMNCTNLKAVAEALRTRWPKREITIAGDNDTWTAGNPGLSKARDAALVVGAKLAVPRFKDTTTKPTDFNDLMCLEGPSEVKRQIEAADAPKETDEDAIERLAKLPPLQYERARKAESEKLGCRESVLDEQVYATRSRIINTQDHSAMAPEVEPWPDQVDGAQLLRDIECHTRRFVMMDTHAGVACALWPVSTHVPECFEYAAIFLVCSATKRCGKSVLKRVLRPMVLRPVSTSNISAAALFRVMEERKPTPLIDELDSLPDGDQKKALTNLLNGGFCKHDSTVIRCDGDAHDLKEFNVYGPKLVASIGELGDTVRDRSIRITLRRKLKSETVERYRDQHIDITIVRRIIRWVADNRDRLTSSKPEIPDELNDRQADIWEPMLAIADLCGHEWPARARAAAVALSAGDLEADGGSDGVTLLRDLKLVFGDDEKASSIDLCERLKLIEEAPWQHYPKQEPINPNHMAKLLKPFGIHSDSVRIGDKTPKGYHRRQFEEHWNAYAVGSVPQKRNSATSPVNTSGIAVSEPQHESPCCASENLGSPNNDRQCCGVAAQSAPSGQLNGVAAAETASGAPSPNVLRDPLEVLL